MQTARKLQDSAPVAVPSTWEQVYERLPTYVGCIFETTEDGVVYRGEYLSENHGTNDVTFWLSRANVRLGNGWQNWTENRRMHLVTCGLSDWYKTYKDGKNRHQATSPQPYLLNDGRIIFSTYSWSEEGRMLWVNVTIYPRYMLEHEWVE